MVEKVKKSMKEALNHGKKRKRKKKPVTKSQAAWEQPSLSLNGIW